MFSLCTFNKFLGFHYLLCLIWVALVLFVHTHAQGLSKSAKDIKHSGKKRIGKDAQRDIICSDCQEADVENVLNEKFRHFITSVHQNLHQEPRNKRAVPDKLPSWRLFAQPPVPVGNASVLEHFYFDGTSYLIAGLYHSDGNFEQEAVIYQWNGGTFVDTGYFFTTYGLADIKTSFISGKLFITAANQQFGSANYEGSSSVMTFDPSSGGLSSYQTIMTYGASCLYLFFFDSQTYLAITNFKTNSYDQYQSELRLYADRGSHFDRILSETTYGATSVATFRYHSDLYLVVGQYVDNEGDYAVGSPVYKFDTDAVTLQKRETLSTTGVVHMELFKINRETYLAVANNRATNDDGEETLWTDSIIYWWTGGQFVEYQTIRTYGAQKWTFVNWDSAHNLLFLFHSMTPDSVTIYEFDETNGWKEARFQFRFPNNQMNAVNSTGAVVAFEQGSETYVIISRMDLAHHKFSSASSNLYMFVEDEKNATVVQTDSLSECIISTLTYTNSSNLAMKTVRQTLDGAMRKSIDQVISTSFIVDGSVDVDNTMMIDDLDVRHTVDYNINPAFVAQAESNKRRIEALMDEASNAVTIYGNEIIRGYTIFQDEVNITGLLKSNISAVTFGGKTLGETLNPLPAYFTLLNITDYPGVIDIRDISQNAVHLDAGNCIIYGEVTVADDLDIWGNLSIGGYLNGLKIPDDLFTMSDDQTFSGVMTFDTNVTFYDNITLLGQWNGLDLREDIVLVYGSHVVDGMKEFEQDVTVYGNLSLSDTKTVQKVDLSEFETEVILLSAGGHVYGNLTFSSETVMEGNLSLDNHMINDLNITELFETVVMIDTDQEISASKTFREKVTLRKNLTMSRSSTLNGLDPSEDLVQLSTQQVITTPVNISGDVDVREHVVVQGFVNDIDLSEEIVTTSGNQSISGYVNFTNDVIIKGDLVFKPGSTIDTTDVSELNETAVRISGSQEVFSRVNFNQDVTFNDDVTAEDLINDVNITLLDQEALSKSKVQDIPLEKNITGNIRVYANMFVNNTMDGYRINDFVLLDENVTVTGHKTFSGPLFVGDDILVEEFIETNGKDLSELQYEILTVFGNQTLSAPVIVFTNGFSSGGNVTVGGYVNELNVTEDLVTLVGNHHVQGKKTFKGSTNSFKSLSADIMTVNGTLDGADINHFYLHAVMNDTNTTVYGLKTFEDVEVLDELEVQGEVDGVALNEFLSSVVFLDGNQTVFSNLTFTTDLQFEAEVFIQDSINSIDLSEFDLEVIYRDEDDVIHGLKDFNGDIIFKGNLQLTGYLDAVDVDELFSNYLSKSLPQTINGFKIFNNSLTADNVHMNESTMLNGIFISDLVLTSEDANISEAVIFTSDVSFRDVNVDGLVDGVDISLLNLSVVWRDGPAQMVSGRKKFIHLIVIGNITIDDLVNGIDVSELESSILDKEKNNTIDVPVAFYGPVTILGNWNITGLIHEVDIDFLLNDAMLVDVDQAVRGDKRFTTDVEVHSINFEDDLTIDVKSEGVSLYWLLNNTVQVASDQEIEGSVTFEKDIIFWKHLNIEGLTDGVDLSEHAVLIATTQEIESSTTFKDGFHAEGNVTVTGLVDFTDLEQLVNTRVTLTTEQAIKGMWIFSEDLYITEDMLVSKKINDIHPVDDVVFIDGNHTITGDKVFTGDVVVKASSIICNVNGVNLCNLSSVVFKEGPHKIHGDIIFATNVTFMDDISVTGLVDGVNVSALGLDQHYVRDKIRESLSNINSSIRNQCYPIYTLTEAVKGFAKVLVYFEEVTAVQNDAIAAVSVLQYSDVIFMAASETYLSSAKDCIHTNLYICSNSGCDIVISQLRPSQSVEFYEFRDRVFLVLTPSPQSRKCRNYPPEETTLVLDVMERGFRKRLSSSGATHSKMFEIEGVLYLALARYQHPKTGKKTLQSLIYQYNETMESFTLHQEIKSNGAKAISSLSHKNQTWIAIANSNGERNSVVYLWNDAAKQFDKSVSFKTSHASDALLFSIGDTLYVAFSNEMKLVRGRRYEDQPIRMYSYSEESGWRLAQEIESPLTLDVDYFVFDDVLYLVALSGQGTIRLFQWTGAAKFQLYKSIPVQGAWSLSSFEFNQGIYLAVTQPVFSPFLSRDVGKTTLLKALIKGVSTKDDMIF